MPKLLFHPAGPTTLLLAALAAPLAAQHAAHRHGVVELDVALQGTTLSLRLVAPLDSLVGFEHPPRTAAQRAATGAALQRIGDSVALFAPDAAALCTPGQPQIDVPAWQTAAATAAAGRPQPDEHAELQASFEFSCRQPAQLSRLQIGLFDAFSRIERIEVRLVLPKSQSKQTLKRAQGTLRLSR